MGMGLNGYQLNAGCVKRTCVAVMKSVNLV